MAKVQPFHRDVDTDVYHNNSECDHGQDVKNNQTYKKGDGGLRLCKRCKELNAGG